MGKVPNPPKFLTPKTPISKGGHPPKNPLYGGGGPKKGPFLLFRGEKKKGGGAINHPGGEKKTPAPKGAKHLGGKGGGTLYHPQGGGQKITPH